VFCSPLRIGKRERFGESVATDLLVQLKELGVLDEFRAAVRLPRPGSARTKCMGGDELSTTITI